MKLLPTLVTAAFLGASLGFAASSLAEDPIDDTGVGAAHNGCKDVCAKTCPTGVTRCHCNAGRRCVDTGN